MTLLSQISLYRELQQDRAAGAPMSLHEVLALEALGMSLRDRSREFAQCDVQAVLSTNTVEHALRVKRLGPESVVCTGVPGVLPSGSFGLRLDDVVENQSYLYRVTVARIERDSADAECEAEFTFVGRPVVLRWERGRSNAPDAVVALETKLCAA